MMQQKICNEERYVKKYAMKKDMLKFFVEISLKAKKGENLNLNLNFCKAPTN